MKKTHSVKRIALRYFAIMMAVTLVCLFLCSGYSAWIYQEQLRYCNEATQVVSRNNLSDTLNSLSEFNRDTCSNDPDFLLLSYESKQISVQQRMESLHHLKREIGSHTPTTGAVFLFNRSASIYYYRIGSQLHNGAVRPADMEFMRNLHASLTAQPDTRLNSWQVYLWDDSPVLVNTYRMRDLYICSLLDLGAFADAYVAGTENIQYAFYTEDRILTNVDYLEAHHITLQNLQEPQTGFFSQLWPDDQIECTYFPEYGIGLASIIPVSGIWNYSQVYFLLVAGALLLIAVTFAAIYSVFRKVLIYPLKEISVASHRLANSDDAEPQDTNLTELVAIRNALDELVEQKVLLTRENENRVQEKNHAMLQYYQLQTRSHFFLNCLKSIYSMTAKGETEKTQRMIMLFSNHLRYIFHDTLSLVTLKSELTEVNDYYQIIQLDRNTPVLLDVKVPPELENCRVPPLTIQTFIENSYKYNNDENKLLRFSIQVDSIVMEEKPYLRLRLSDNGKGYSPEVLESLSQPGELFETYHVGIKNLRRRISILFDGDYQMAFFNNKNGGAMTVIYLPIERGEEDKT